jgi:hypothetical protein
VEDNIGVGVDIDCGIERGIGNGVCEGEEDVDEEAEEDEEVDEEDEKLVAIDCVIESCGKFDGMGMDMEGDVII